MAKYILDISDLVNDIYKNAVDHGWHEKKLTFGELIALCHAELSEALEEYRNGNKPDEVYAKGCPNSKMSIKAFGETYADNVKPEGIPMELADVIIRIFDICGYYGIDIAEAIKIKHSFNKNRPYRHGGKIL